MIEVHNHAPSSMLAFELEEQDVAITIWRDPEDGVVHVTLMEGVKVSRFRLGEPEVEIELDGEAP